MSPPAGSVKTCSLILEKKNWVQSAAVTEFRNLDVRDECGNTKVRPALAREERAYQVLVVLVEYAQKGSSRSMCGSHDATEGYRR